MSYYDDGISPEKGARRSRAAAKALKAARNKKKKTAKTAKKNERQAPGWIRDGAVYKQDFAGKRNFKDSRLGTFGAASEVRKIDPAEYLKSKGTPT